MTRATDTNTGTRYFYTDPLAAAWMASNYGMAFENARLTLIQGGPGNSNYSDISWSLRIYDNCFPIIHPDSLHLLEPKVGDLVEEALDGKVCNGHSFDYFSDPHRIIERIIQRDGKPFFWPESEEA